MLLNVTIQRIINQKNFQRMISSINSIDHSFLFYWCKSGFIYIWVTPKTVNRPQCRFIIKEQELSYCFRPLVWHLTCLVTLT